MYCICCKKDNVIPFDGTSRVLSPSYKLKKNPHHPEITEEDILWKKNKRPDGSLVNVNNEMIDNGIIHIIDAGYGSKHDGDQIILAICDDCIKENLEDATLLYYDNYMFPDESSEEDIEKSKQKYRRRKNLDDLV
jgi:hypothetical protein